MKKVLLLALAALAAYPQNRTVNVNQVLKGGFDARTATWSRPFRSVTSDQAGACSNASEWAYNTVNGKLFHCLSGTWTELVSSGGGEVNTASNVGAAAAVFASKVGVDLRFRSIASTTASMLTATQSANTIDLTILPGGFSLSALGGSLNLSQLSGAGASNGSVVKHNGSAWIVGSDVGFADPLTTRGDLIYRGVGGTTRIALGSNNQCLISNGTDAIWAACPGSFSDPLTTRGDIIYRGAGGTTRLPLGSSGFCLVSNGTDAVWGTCSNIDLNTITAPGGTLQVNTAVIPSIASVQNGDLNSATCTVISGNDWQCNPTAAFGSITPTKGSTLKAFAPANSTGALRLAVSPGGNLRRAYNPDGTTQITTELVSGRLYEFTYDSTRDGGTGGWLLLNSASAGDPNAVTAAGTLTSNAPMIGAGSKAAAVGTRSGNTTEFATVTGTKTTNKQLAFDASGNVIASASDIGGGGGPATPFDFNAYASRGACNSGTKGQTFFASEVSYNMHWVCDGSNWQQIVHGRKVTPPTVACASLTLTRSATCSEGIGTMRITAALSGVSSGRVAIPAGDWTKYMLLSCMPADFGNPQGCGIVFNDGTVNAILLGIHRSDSNFVFTSKLWDLSATGTPAGAGPISDSGPILYPFDRVLLRIQRVTNDITISYNTGTQWVTYGTFALAQWWGTINAWGPAMWSTTASTSATVTVYEWDN